MSPDPIKTCIDVNPPRERMVEAAKAAVAENPSNVPAVRIAPTLGVVRPSPAELAALTGKKWQNGRTLRVAFLDGDPVARQRVQPFARKWEDFANLRLVFVNDPDAEIRISFRQVGSWSYIGTDALSIPRGEPTMNFGWLTADTEDDEYSRVVTHEFGHVLGCIHEHQNPAANIPWNKPAVYQFYEGPPNYWSQHDVDVNLFQRYSRDLTQFTQLDPESIMLYPIPKAFTFGGFEVGWNKILSPTDKRFAAAIYPKREKPIVDLTIGAAPRLAPVGNDGEDDWYRFVVISAGVYAVETHGWTNVLLRLYGPNDRATLIAQDDDVRLFVHARVGAVLNPAVYYVSVTHHGPAESGNYGISVRAAT